MLNKTRSPTGCQAVYRAVCILLYTIIIYTHDWSKQDCQLRLDKKNARKNDKHGVSKAEAEQIFFNNPLLLIADTEHSHDEQRFQNLPMRLKSKPFWEGVNSFV